MLRQGLILIPLLCSPVFAGEQGLNPSQSEFVETTPDRAVIYWEGFSENHVTEIPVQYWLSDRQTPFLWAGTLSGIELRVSWNDSSQAVEVDVMLDGVFVAVDDLVMVDVFSGRPTWEAAFDKDGIPLLSGMVDVDEVNECVVLGVSVDGVHYRTFAISNDTQSDAAYGATVLVMTSCICFGKGAVTKTCGTNDCDVGEKCGPDRACRWSADSIEANNRITVAGDNVLRTLRISLKGLIWLRGPM